MLLYNLGVRFYGLAIRVASLRGSKAKQWVRGRRSWRSDVARVDEKFRDAPRIWIHCASYGEFEQGRPVIEALRKKYPSHRIILTFFSPSGYEPFKDWKGADAVLYLPLDTPRNAKSFIGLVDPAVVIFIKYEFWLNYLKEIKRRAIPCYLVSAVFKAHHPFFRWYGGIFRKSLSTFNTLFIQDQNSGKLLEAIGINNYKVTGDTRFDRVMQIRREPVSFDWLNDFRHEGKLIVAGSTWASDDELVLEAFKKAGKDVKLLLVPHDIDERSIESARVKAGESGERFSMFSEGVDPESRILILDTIGMLARVYALADVAYVGGGFDGGIHNSLEPAVFGVPITFYGNDYTKFNEAIDLLAMGAAVNVKTPDELADAWERLLEPAHAARIRNDLESYFADKGNSSEAVVAEISI